MKPTSSFRLSKTTKRRLARFPDPHVRGRMKRGMIDAELSASMASKRTRSDDSSQNSGI